TRSANGGAGRGGRVFRDESSHQLKIQVRGLAERGARGFKVGGWTHPEIHARPSPHHRFRIELVGKSQSRAEVLAIRRNCPVAGSRKLSSTQQLHRGGETHAAASVIGLRQSRLYAAHI